MLSEEAEECSSLSNNNVKEIVDLLEEAVRVSCDIEQNDKLNKISFLISIFQRISPLWLSKNLRNVKSWLFNMTQHQRTRKYQHHQEDQIIHTIC